MTRRIIYLLRHGQHQSVADKLRSDLTLEQHIRVGLKEGGLSPAGMDQVELTAKRLQVFPISVIYSSSLRRAAETADIIAQAFPGVPLRRSRLLWECIPCVPPALFEKFAGVSTEVIARQKRQAESAFEKYFKRPRGNDKHEIVICHGNIIRYFVCRILQAPLESWMNMSSYNCGISKVEIRSDGTMRLISYNDVGHLPHHLITSWAAA